MLSPEGEFPELPLKITELPETSLMEFYEQYRRWLDWYDSCLTEKIKIEERVSQKTSKELNLALLENKSQKNVTLVKAAAEIAPDYLNELANYQSAKNLRRDAELNFRRAERAYWHCKTELDRRKRPAKPEKVGFGHLD